MKTYIRFKQHKIRLQTIEQIEPQQKYRLGTISNIKLRGGWGDGVGAWGGGGLKPVLQASDTTLIFCSCSQHLVSCESLTSQ